MRRKFLLYILLMSTLFLTAKAQVAFVAAGGEASGSGGSESYSIGQVTYLTHMGTDGSIAEGVQQPYEISITTETENTDISLSMSVFPNPVKHHLIIKIKDDSWMTEQSIVNLYDVKGKLLKQNIVVANETIIDMTQLKPAVYILKIVQNSQEVKVFKIVKN